MNLERFRTMAQQLQENVGKVIVGKNDVVELFIIAMTASGHILLEDVPGTGKTLLAKTMAKSLDCQFKRVQFTPDLMPSDLSGIHYFNQKTSEFEFREGPIFTNVLLADEINRATPRSQSSLLECMEERQVSIDGHTFVLERPFFVIATQNPIENQGTFPLPEAQLDRFIMKIRMGYPDTQQFIEILDRFKERQPLNEITKVATKEDIVAGQDLCRKVAVSAPVMEYLVAVLERTRSHADVAMGVSPRGGQALLKTIQIRAALRGRDYVMPDDIKALSPHVLAHRLVLRDEIERDSNTAEGIIASILNEIPVPTEARLQEAAGG
ncbi:AAA family ATPase [Paenibacillus sp. 1P07SE]|uniref:AAA family ATPase n=1 Tax=Paenibacillus sp. 1P07SE TaxID=3132209 RepID=UPI0039A5B3C9